MGSNANFMYHMSIPNQNYQLLSAPIVYMYGAFAFQTRLTFFVPYRCSADIGIFHYCDRLWAYAILLKLGCLSERHAS